MRQITLAQEQRNWQRSVIGVDEIGEDEVLIPLRNYRLFNNSEIIKFIMRWENVDNPDACYCKECVDRFIAERKFDISQKSSNKIPNKVTKKRTQI